MKTIIRILITTSLCFVAITSLEAQTQHITLGEVLKGITAEDWGIVQEAYLKASNTDGGDEFGTSVAISGNTDALSSMIETKLTVSDGSLYQRVFGYSICLNGDTKLIGNPCDDSYTDTVSNGECFYKVDLEP